MNVAVLIGNTALRVCALGWEDVAADHMAMADMRAMLREGMEEGAFGLSSGLDYPPGAYASTEELADLTNAAAREGGFYHTHVRYELGDRFLDPFREAMAIGDDGPRTGPPHPLLSSPDLSGRSRTDARPGGRRASGRRRRHLRHVPVRVGVHAPAHPAPALDPVRRAAGP